MLQYLYLLIFYHQYFMKVPQQNSCSSAKCHILFLPQCYHHCYQLFWDVGIRGMKQCYFLSRIQVVVSNHICFFIIQNSWVAVSFQKTKQNKNRKLTRHKTLTPKGKRLPNDILLIYLIYMN